MNRLQNRSIRLLLRSFQLIALFINIESFANCNKLYSMSISDSASYTKLKRQVEFLRDSISSRYKIKNNLERAIELKKTEELLLNTYYTTLIPKWLGTKWAFYGETQFPGDSSIACGHFVVTTLKHLGFQIDSSYEMATNFSAYMVNSLCDTSYKVVKASEMIEIVKKSPDDVWVVGLRNHSGLLIKYNGVIHFVHSSCTFPTMVVDELVEESSTFNGSNIFVAGPLFKNNSLVEKWILGKKLLYTKKHKK